MTFYALWKEVTAPVLWQLTHQWPSIQLTMRYWKTSNINLESKKVPWISLIHTWDLEVSKCLQKMHFPRKEASPSLFDKYPAVVQFSIWPTLLELRVVVPSHSGMDIQGYTDNHGVKKEFEVHHIDHSLQINAIPRVETCAMKIKKIVEPNEIKKWMMIKPSLFISVQEGSSQKLSWNI